MLDAFVIEALNEVRRREAEERARSEELCIELPELPELGSHWDRLSPPRDEKTHDPERGIVVIEF